VRVRNKSLDVWPGCELELYKLLITAGYAFIECCNGRCMNSEAIEARLKILQLSAASLPHDIDGALPTT
jgi:hypothetical protein